MSMASQINSDDPVVICKCGNLFLPVASVTTPAVDKNKRGLSPADNIISDALSIEGYGDIMPEGRLVGRTSHEQEKGNQYK